MREGDVFGIESSSHVEMFAFVAFDASQTDVLEAEGLIVEVVCEKLIH